MSVLSANDRAKLIEAELLTGNGEDYKRIIERHLTEFAQAAAHTASEAMREACRAALKLPRPWIDGGISYEEWDKAFQKIEAAIDGNPDSAQWLREHDEKVAAKAQLKEVERQHVEWESLSGWEHGVHPVGQGKGMGCVICKRWTELKQEEGL